jgi:muconolactone D-isomerase
MLAGYEREGKIVAGGVMAGRRGSCVIFDVESIEEFQRLVSQLPMYPFMDVEVIPLVSLDDTMKGLEGLRSATS